MTKSKIGKKCLTIIIFISCIINVLLPISQYISYHFTNKERSKLEDMNSYSKAAYNSIYESLEKRLSKGVTYETILDSGYFGICASEDGFRVHDTLLYNQPKAKGDNIINQRLSRYVKQIGYQLVVYIGIAEIDNETELFVQVRDASQPTIIGQYPSEIKYDNMNKVVWTEYLSQ